MTHHSKTYETEKALGQNWHEMVTCQPTDLCAQCGLRPGVLRHTLPATNVCHLCWGMHECFVCEGEPDYFIDVPPRGTIYFCGDCVDFEVASELIDLLFDIPPEIGEYDDGTDDEED